MFIKYDTTDFNHQNTSKFQIRSLTAIMFIKILISMILILMVETRAAGLPKFRPDCSEMPQVCANMLDAIESGAPSVLTRVQDSSRISANRKAAYGRNRERYARSKDEYPFASTLEGGYGAYVQDVPSRENSIQGGQLSNFYRENGIQNGHQFEVDVKHLREELGRY